MWTLDEADMPSRARRVARYQDLFHTSRDAGFLGRDGRPGDGYRCLLEGFRRAEDARAEGEPWGEDLVARYLRALHDYARQYGLTRLYHLPSGVNVRRSASPGSPS